MSKTFDMTGVSVMLAMPVNRDIPVPTVISLIATVNEMLVRNIPFELQIQLGGSIIETARSKCAHLFLKSDKTRLFFVDSDMEWSAKDFMRLLALSTKMDVVGAAYPIKKDPPQFFLNVADGEAETDEYGCLSIKGMGLGFTVVQRHVIEKLAAKAPVLKFPDVDDPMPHIFRCDAKDGDFRGEDMAFFADIRALGYEVNIDPSINLGHVGQKTYRASFDAMIVPEPE